MPSDVAVNKPRAGVIELECESKVAVRWQHCCIPTNRVLCLEGSRASIPRVTLLSQDPEVVAVEMDWVSET